jgi:hypothetical protein
LVWSRVILRLLSVLNWGTVCGCVIYAIFGVVVGGFVIVSRCSVGCGVVNWSLGVVFILVYFRRISCFVVSLGYVVLGRLSCGCVARGRAVLVGLGVVGRGSILDGVVGSFGGVVPRHFDDVGLNRGSVICHETLEPCWCSRLLGGLGVVSRCCVC